MLRSQLVSEVEEAEAKIVEIELNTQFSRDYKDEAKAQQAADIAKFNQEIIALDRIANQSKQ